MASVWVERRKQGYILRWRTANAGADATGPRWTKHASAAYPTKADALREARRLSARLGLTPRGRKAGPRPAPRMTLRELALAWQSGRRRGGGPGESPYTDLVVATVTRLSAELAWGTIHDCNLPSLSRWRAGRTGGDRTLAYLRLVLRWSAEHLDQPYDLRVDAALRARQSREADVELYSEAQMNSVRSMALLLQQGVLIDCLATYGWRPITACRLTCGDLRADGTITIGVKRNGAWSHPLFPFHAEQLRALADTRRREEPLFIAPTGKAWRHAASADQLGQWYRDNLRPTGADGNIYQLKRWAITRMHAGGAPWPRRLTIPEIQTFTGLRSKTQVLRYLRSSMADAHDLVGASMPHVGPIIPHVGHDGARGA